MDWVWLLIFLASQGLIAVWASRSIKSATDFFVAGRKLGPLLVTFSLFATWFGAETCLGASGAVYTHGLSGARADPFGYSICLLLVGFLIAERLASGPYLTLGDFYRHRYGPRVEKLAVCVLLPSSLGWAAAQMRAMGEVLASTSPLDVQTAIPVAALFVVLYTFVGGLLSDVITDLVQGLILTIGLCFLLVATIWNLPSDFLWSTALSSSRLNPLPTTESIWIQIDRWSVPILGSLITQELIARVLAARSPSIAKLSALRAGVIYIIVGTIPIFLGLLGPSLVPDLQDPEQLLPTLAKNYLPHTAYIIFSYALLAALLSTIDSILLSLSALVSHNIFTPVLHLQNRPKAGLWLGRLTVSIFGAIACGISLNAQSVYSLVEEASKLGTAGILVTTMGGLWFSGGSPLGAALSILVGLFATPMLDGIVAAPFLLSVLSAGGIFAIQSIFWPNREPGALLS
ncbi:MAG: sodium:solute symporter family protein [Myxococcales bacterium]|nr:sodium:solute symporter family protein [Myxococcales bacterium]